jgi:polar amino acid transport system permease protein
VADPDLPERGEVEAIKAIPVRHPGRWVAAGFILVLVAQFVHWLVTDSALQWGVVGHYLFDSQILTGVENTIKLTIIAMAMGVVLGIGLAVMRLSKNPIVSGVAWVYIWFFRGTPVLVQLIFWFNLPSVLRSVSLGIPFGPSWFHTDPKDLITQLIAVCLGLGLNEAAYMAEIARAGINSVDPGQMEAAQAVGMSRSLAMRRIVLPQAMRVIVPPTGNETIAMLKDTSLLIALPLTTEMFYQLSQIGTRTFQLFPVFVAATLYYLIATSVLMIGQAYLERRFGRGFGTKVTSTQDKAAIGLQAGAAK